PCLQPRVRHDFAGLNRYGRERRQKQQTSQGNIARGKHHGHSAGCGLGTCAFRARRAIPTLKLRSERDRHPPKAMTKAPIQIKDTSGFQKILALTTPLAATSAMLI